MSSAELAAILLDIEGTTTSIAFVKEILFSYAAQNVEKFLANDAKAPILEELAQLSNEQAKIDGEISEVDADKIARGENLRKWIDALAKNVRVWIAHDKKLTALKKLQGAMWQNAYENGEVKGHVFADVAAAFARWQTRGISIFIFSSGSILAQKLLFRHSDSGDLTKYLSGYFDTTVGAKVEVESYTKIARQIGKAPSKILFVTDIEKEAFAADSAQFRVALSLRDGNAPVSDEARAKFPQIFSFDEIDNLHFA